MILDFLFNYYGISSYIIFSYMFIFNKSYINILIIGFIMDLFYYKYYVIYLLIWYFIIKIIYKYIKKNIVFDIILLYLITFIYYLITVSNYEFKLIFIYSFFPCIFYLIYHIIKYEMDKQNISSCINNIMHLNRVKKKQKI